MNWYQVQSKWRSVKGTALTEWDRLSLEDVDAIAGDRARFIGTLERQYGLPRDEAERRADAWARDIINC